MVGKQFLGKSPVDSADTLGGQNFHQNRSILHSFRDNAFLCFTQKQKMATKNGGERFLGKSHHLTGGKIISGKRWHMKLETPCGPKILLKLLSLAPFL